MGSLLHVLSLSLTLFEGNVLGIKEESRIGVIQTLWNYIKLNNLQDKVDRRVIRADDYLRPVSILLIHSLAFSGVCTKQIFGGESLMFQHIPELVNRFLMPPDPIVLHYNVNPSGPPPDRPSAWDVEVKMDDGAMKTRMSAALQANKESMQDLSKIDDQVSDLIGYIGSQILNALNRSHCMHNLYKTHI